MFSIKIKKNVANLVPLFTSSYSTVSFSSFPGVIAPLLNPDERKKDGMRPSASNLAYVR
jgi:hypothetical protein